MDYRTSIKALFEAVLLNEEGFEYQKPGQLSKNKRNQAEYEDRREKELSGRIVTRGGGNLLDKDLMPGAYRQAARGKRAIEADSPHSKDRYGVPRSVPDTHTFMNLAHVRADNAAKRAARERRLARKAAKAQQQNSSTDHSRDNLRDLFEAALLEGERKMQMKRDSDKYPGGPAEKQLYQAKPGQLTPDGKKQLQKASADYAAATKKARDERKVESIRNNFSLILKEATYQPGKAKKSDKHGTRWGTAKLSKSRIKGMTRSDAESASAGAARKNISRQQDADFRKKHGKLSREERIKANRETNRPRGVLKKDPQSHYPQD